ncbi:class I SAM-dependent methyltransferase [Bacillus aquiflavi]|uniref:Class I SAM-dependent methyltransferase n=1 Tax=Bacillus aquiflavi TaxID=2672567 RepID=A0A6B3VWH6_9BACI|nr:class I SAM-dependent methyltransferase [Bacillus aquiflavi]MBA4537144.1 class I SAM-dependent methyltransferase [Bacillus aquiflavi]NEY82419.1 class I SAM-dependent methyltransferase [Bacillus aquiflavi]UAC49769.1 class I SAM-dependent methyltransferase [Bacillus aquiflavi]
MFSYYGKLSTELYDFTKPVGQSIDGDIEYYVERLQNVEGKVLEAGVGSGRVMIPLLEKGFVVDGIDDSPYMLGSCRERCAKRGLTPQLYEMRIENFQLPDQYEAIIMPTGSFCLIDNHEDSIRALTCFKSHLVPGGRIIIDLLLPNNFKAGEITTETFALPNGEGITMESKSIEIDWVHQRTKTYLKYEKWKNGKLIDTELQEFILRWYGIEEFRLILEQIGFRNISCSSGYVYNKYPTNPKEVITFEAYK